MIAFTMLLLFMTAKHNKDFNRSNYIDFAQGGISSRAIDNWLWMFSLFFAKKNSKHSKKIFYKRDIMQLFSADTTMFLKETLKFFACENMKKPASKVAHNRPQFFFQYCQPAQNQPKSNILFHKNGSRCDFYIMTLILTPCSTFTVLKICVFTGSKIEHLLF